MWFNNYNKYSITTTMCNRRMGNNNGLTKSNKTITITIQELTIAHWFPWKIVGWFNVSFLFPSFNLNPCRIDLRISMRYGIVQLFVRGGGGWVFFSVLVPSDFLSSIFFALLVLWKRKMCPNYLVQWQQMLLPLHLYLFLLVFFIQPFKHALSLPLSFSFIFFAYIQNYED